MTRREGEPATTDGLTVPSLIDPPEEKADWVELYALKDDDGNASFADLISALGLSGTADAIEEEDDEGPLEELTDEDHYEGAAEAAFQEITDRVDACRGVKDGYPFALTNNAVLRRNDSIGSVYCFLLMLSRFGHKAGGSEGAKLFEELCAEAAKSYFGIDKTHVRSSVFGFPRRVGPAGFARALDALCCELGEGRGARQRPNSADQKDAKLDVVAWRSFADGRQGKLIAFGQCATGTDWKNKTTELGQPMDWCRLWMQDTPAVPPIRMFFVPHRISETVWFQTCVNGGILFDRCRIVQHSESVPEDLREQLAEWSVAAVAENLK